MKSHSIVRFPALRNSLVLALLLFVVVEGRPPAQPSDAELAAITERGRLLAGYDGAAWQATDALMATRPAKDRLGTYIALKTDQGWTVVFGRLDEAGEKFLVAYEAINEGTEGKYRVEAVDPPRGEDGWIGSAARGIRTASQDFGSAKRPYNAAVLPAERGELYVYVYPAQTKKNSYTLGGDVRYRMSPDGATVLEKRQLHRSVIDYPPPKKGDKVEGGFHTHVLTDVPEDTDVLMVLTRKPQAREIVAAGDYLFSIGTEGKITIAGRIQ